MADDRSTEVSLLAALSAGDPSAFWPLWESHAARLLSVCLREMNGNRADAEDALGDAMMRALEKLPRHAPRIIAIEPWLVRLTLNVCTDVHRRRLRGTRIAVEFGFNAERGAAVVVETPEPEVDPVSLIARLPERLREVLVLRVLKRMPYDDIANRLDLTCANARKRVQQARAALRTMRDGTFQNSQSGGLLVFKTASQDFRKSCATEVSRVEKRVRRRSS
jgi:RNA polymerase sigma-70 factor (ECF subfamily)